ncbi:MAG TPA: tyrosine-type recombinase/integrase [Thermodesulfobacteriota bacterium]|nr:tyrosine-type recombinase/integrase [Thermodesulfobacteriota bacterium]
MTQGQLITDDSVQSGSEVVREEPLSPTPIDRILQKLSCLEFPAKEHFEHYLRHKWRLNHKPRTLASSFTSVRLFLDFYGKSGKSAIEKVERVDLEGFIEQEQDRGLRISTVRTRLACIIAFLHFLMEQDIVPGSILKRGIKLKLPDVLPRAMNPSDVRKLLLVIDDIRDRALFLLLLRTGIRIGEALGLRLNDLDIQGRKVHLYEGEKNSMGRVVYLSDDALFALKLWLRRRDKNKEFVFYGQGHGHLCYSSGRYLFVKYLKKAGIDQKGYTVHCLRHTFASELLNAGMRLECLQQLLGHQDIEVTRRYARLTDTTREEEYFRAMAVIEKGGIDGAY